MKKLEFSIDIKADKAKVWRVLWDDTTYRKWTSVFFNGSHAVTRNWEEGTRVLFLDPNGSGMYSSIEKHIPNEFMSIKHIGFVKEGKEQPLNDETRKWSGAMENYRLTESDNSIILTVESETQEHQIDFMKKIFPKALNLVKTLSED